MQNKLSIKNKKLKTSILIKKNYISKFIKNIAKKNEKVFCIIDSKIKINLNFKKQKNIKIISIKCGEKIKTFDGYKNLAEKLIKNNVNRKSVIIAIGGGTLGDLAGFVASTVLRGLDFFLIPTTLLSQVDSSIGGKNGINTIYGKNLLGTFYQPKEVLIDISVLNSLPKKEIKSGYAEIIKHALIKDYSFFCWLEKNANKLLNLNKSILEKAIYKSIMIKLFYVKKDEKEFLLNNNSRAMLNFGHTIGHAIESHYNYKKFNHGEAISIGMITEAKISNYLGLLSSNELERIIIHFKKCRLKIYDNILKDKILIKKITKDKKNFQNNINFSLIDKIGSSIFYKKLDKNKVYKILQNI
ncbi:MAG: 3-dehydroquinate synthase [Alphaproteobacteria bacterium]|nr:MAG: 3-dehydroquinate synthase [Alphaproteobacteria bacterium]